MLNLKETNHNYYCECCETKMIKEFESWKDFKTLDIDMDYNLLFRFDLVKEAENDYTLQLHYALQRHGESLLHFLVHNIKEEDLKEINNYLAKAKEHLFKMWEEV